MDKYINLFMELIKLRIECQFSLNEIQLNQIDTVIELVYSKIRDEYKKEG